jgi:hypothetical protein
VQPVAFSLAIKNLNLPGHRRTPPSVPETADWGLVSGRICENVPLLSIQVWGAEFDPVIQISVGQYLEARGRWQGRCCLRELACHFGMYSLNDSFAYEASRDVVAILRQV